MKVKSFEELGKHMRVNARNKKPEKPRTCNKCGGNLHLIPGTNVYICDGINPTTQKPFEHKVLTRKLATT